MVNCIIQNTRIKYLNYATRATKLFSLVQLTLDIDSRTNKYVCPAVGVLRFMCAAVSDVNNFNTNDNIYSITKYLQSINAMI